MNGGRISGEDTSYWSVCLGLVVVILVGSAVFYFSSSRAESKKNAPYDYNKPVPTDAELRNKLKEDQYKSARQNWTEPAFQNDYWNNDKAGLYVDIVTGDPLFSSHDKFDFKNGRVNFSKPLAAERIVQRPDVTHPELNRIEIRTARGDSHLGFLFHDGPPPTGERYCVNSASLKFIPADRLETEGYGQFKALFPEASPAGQQSPTSGP